MTGIANEHQGPVLPGKAYFAGKRAGKSPRKPVIQILSPDTIRRDDAAGLLLRPRLPEANLLG